MASALITLQLLSTLLLLYPPWTGLQAASVPLREAFNRHYISHHILTAFPAFTLAVFAHAMTMFYFIGTGKTVKLARAARPDLVTEAEVALTVRFKRITSPLFTFAILMLIAAPVSGGALLQIPRGGPGGWLTLHLVVVLATLALQFYTAYQAVRIIRENVRLLDAIDARLIASPEPAPPAA